MQRFVLTVLLVGVTCAAGKVLPEKYATPKKCCLPDEWEGKMTQVAGLIVERQRSTTGSYAIATVHVDAKTPRMRSSAETYNYSSPGKMMQTDVYINKTATFVAYPDQKTCHKVDIPLTINNCIPDNAIYGGARTYGDSKSPVITDDWLVFVSAPGVTGFAQVSVTQDQCFPITQLNTGDSSAYEYIKYEYMNYDEFFDLKEGIKDPSVFDPPAYCKSAKETTDHNIIRNVKAMMKFGFSL